MAFAYKKPEIKKSILYTLIVILLFFGSIEAIQRIRYCLRYKSSYWLLYGFVEIPENYEKIMQRGVLQIVESRVVSYRKGKRRYRKYNPKFQGDEFINSYGFRGKEFSLKKADGVYRLVALGGSTTFGLGLKDGFTYPDYLEKIVNSNANKKFEVINAGISGNTIYEIANLFEEEIIALEPDIIVINSMLNNLYYSKIMNNSQVFPISWQRINRILLTKSLFYMTLREKLAVLFQNNIANIYRADRNQVINNFLKTEVFWSNLENVFKDIIHNGKSHNIEVIIVEEPVSLSFFPDESWIMLDRRMEPIYKKMLLLFRKISRDENIDIVETHDYFDQISPKDYFIDGVHLTPKGSEYLADLIAKKVLPLISTKKL